MTEDIMMMLFIFPENVRADVVSDSKDIERYEDKRFNYTLQKQIMQKHVLQIDSRYSLISKGY